MTGEEAPLRVFRGIRCTLALPNLFLPFRALKCCLDFNSIRHKFMACHFQAFRNLALQTRDSRAAKAFLCFVCQTLGIGGIRGSVFP